MAQASQQEMNRFVAVVDEFMQKYARLTSAQTRSDVFATGDAALIADYNSAVSKGGILKTAIETTVGAWSAAKRAYASVTDTTSLVIGDAVDWFKDLFGGGPQVNGLGVIQLPAAVWVAGIIGSAVVLINLMNNIFTGIEATKIQRQNPGISRQDALRLASSNVGIDFFGGVNQTLLLGGVLFAAWYFLRKE